MGRRKKQQKPRGNRKNIAKNAKRIQKNLAILKSIK